MLVRDALVQPAVHPRASGERQDRVGGAGPDCGSSPRERGTPLVCRVEPLRERFIPARAGNASRATRRRASRPVHPRASGERNLLPACAGGWDGSSPRERGTPPPVAQGLTPLRFIPARAGNAETNAGRNPAVPVHPRASGERHPLATLLGSRLGSSPRERGTPDRAQHFHLPRRFIPARAGNAADSCPYRAPHPVHPRASGERQATGVLGGLDDGSSPRERGTHLSSRGPRWFTRFIPARAGNAQWGRDVILTMAVHPRASGERDCHRHAAAHHHGSSPRERGTHFCHLHEIKWKNGLSKFYRRFVML